MEVFKCWKIVGFPKILITMENCETTSCLKEIIQPLHHPYLNETVVCLLNKTFLTEKYRYLQKYCNSADISRYFYFIRYWAPCLSWENINQCNTMGVSSDFCVQKFKNVPITPHLILEIAQIASQIPSK